MEGLFRQIGIYSLKVSNILQDREQVAYYKEDSKGQILQVSMSWVRVLLG